MQQLLQQVILRRAGKKPPSGQAGEVMTWYCLVNGVCANQLLGESGSFGLETAREQMNS